MKDDQYKMSVNTCLTDDHKVVQDFDIVGSLCHRIFDVAAEQLDAGVRTQLQRLGWITPEDARSLIPNDCYYMDPPDGGDVPLIEQLRRMAEDAWKYRQLNK